MAAGIENVYEDENLRRHRPAFGHASIEINAHCPFATLKGCGDRCVLIARNAPSEQLLDASEIREAFCEILDCGPALRHCGVPGMEPMASPEILFELLELYHARPSHKRPATFNMITSGVHLEKYANRFKKVPVDALIISVDDSPSTGLRVVGAGDRAIKGALDIRERGGCHRVCVNTIFAKDNGDAVLAIAKRLREVHVDQMLISPLLTTTGSRFVPVVTQTDLLSLAYRAANSAAIDGLSVLVEVDLETIRGVAGGNSGYLNTASDWSTRWRLNDSNVSLMAVHLNAPFVRIRWDGQLMVRSELFRVGLARTEAGRYSPGRIRDLLGVSNSLPLEEACVA